MPRSYLRLMPDFFERKARGTEHRDAYSAAQIATYVGVLCLAEQQPERGRFRNRRILRVLLEEIGGKVYARQLAFLFAQEDLVEKPDGTVYVEGWDELQEGDFSVRERVQRYRERHGNVTESVTSTVTNQPPRPLHGNDSSALQSNGGERYIASRGTRTRVAGGEAISNKQQATSNDAVTSASDAAAADVQRCVEAWTSATGQTVPAQLWESIEAWVERVGAAMVLSAIRETGANGARAWKYTNAILERWAVEGMPALAGQPHPATVDPEWRDPAPPMWDPSQDTPERRAALLAEAEARDRERYSPEELAEMERKGNEVRARLAERKAASR